VVTCLPDSQKIGGSSPSPATNNNKMKTLLLQIKKEFFDQVEAGTKLIDYRDVTEFWIARLIEEILNPDTENEDYIFTQFDQVKFLCGKKTLVKKHVKTEIDIEEGLFHIHIS